MCFNSLDLDRGVLLAIEMSGSDIENIGVSIFVFVVKGLQTRFVYIPSFAIKLLAYRQLLAATLKCISQCRLFFSLYPLRSLEFAE